MKRLLSMLAGLLACVAAHAQPIEILTLRHRSAEQAIPQLQPLLAPGGALTGSGAKLFVRTTPANLADLRRVLDEIDREPRRLLITVRRGGDVSREASGAGIGGGQARIYSSGTGSRDNVVQQVQTIEGGRAVIGVGESVPVPIRRRIPTPGGSVVTETVEYRDLGSGFVVEPHLVGERVTLDIGAAQDRPTGQPGVAETQRLSTVVSGRLGEWIELGGMRQDSAEQRSDIARYSTRSVRDERRLWLKVEQLP